LNAYGISETGKVRANNEDALFYSDTAFFCLPNLYIVADGMGGHKSGEIASSKAIEFFIERCESNNSCDEILDFLVESANYANRRVYEMSCLDESLYGMGTTFTACSYKDGKLNIAHIGDTRLYSIKNKKIKHHTTDHTYVNEMIRAGQLTEKEARKHRARNMLMRALGSERVCAIDGYVISPGKSKILLCSDGLNGMITDNEILSAFNAENDNKKISEILTQKALTAGGLDNITVIIFDLEA
jgi:protein phosphatase